MSQREREKLYALFQHRLISFYEIQPGRFCHSQWNWLMKKENK